jgi:hypothetical protein
MAGPTHRGLCQQLHEKPLHDELRRISRSLQKIEAEPPASEPCDPQRHAQGHVGKRNAGMC